MNPDRNKERNGGEFPIPDPSGRGSERIENSLAGRLMSGIITGVTAGLVDLTTLVSLKIFVPDATVSLYTIALPTALLTGFFIGGFVANKLVK